MDIWFLLKIVAAAIIVFSVVYRIFLTKYTYVYNDESSFQFSKNSETKIVEFDEILEINIQTLKGEYVGGILITENKKFKLSLQDIERKKLVDFGLKNKIKIKEIETYHGGGEKIINK